MLRNIVLAFFAILGATVFSYSDSINVTPATLSKSVVGTRDLTVASGSVGYTGFGFRPRSCIGNGAIADGITYRTVIGFSDNARVSYSTWSYGGASIVLSRNANFFVFADATAANLQLADIASYDTDGLTLTWTKTGAPTGTVVFTITCSS